VTKKKKQVKSDQKQVDDIYKDYEPDGRDLAEHLASQEKWIADNPDVKMEDVAEYHAELQSEIERGK
tara:strand:- start:542 stop:742 length:201 start_codon:yes stop_codon:yes gene_type:complete